MKQAAAAAVLLTAALAAGCGATHTTVKTVTVAGTPSATPGAKGEQRLFGRIVSVRRRGGRYELRFDPSWFVSGVTANVAQAEDQGISCRPTACPPVANDSFDIDEGHRVLTFLMPANAHGLVLAKSATGFQPTRVTAAQLAEVVAGASPIHLYEPLSTGMWLLVRIDTVRTFAQQYRP